MAGNLLGKPFEDYVNEQIERRQKIQGKSERTLDEIQYLSNRNAWIKLASGVEIDENRIKLLNKVSPNLLLTNSTPGKSLARQSVLFNGLSNFESPIFTGATLNNPRSTNFLRSGVKNLNNHNQDPAYGVGNVNNFGYSPMPGIIDMDFKCLNRGSIKKATLNIKAHNKDQFDIIDVLYLRLGYSVFMEWGYDKYIDNGGRLQQMNETLIDFEFWSSKYNKSDYSEWLPQIEKRRQETDGNYDGMFGTISNFSWTFNDDGSYDIKVEIMSLGDIIESLKVNISPFNGVQVNPRVDAKFKVLKSQLQADPSKLDTLAQNEFYSILYPGLESRIEEWYKDALEIAKNYSEDLFQTTIPFNTILRNSQFLNGRGEYKWYQKFEFLGLTNIGAFASAGSSNRNERRVKKALDITVENVKGLQKFKKIPELEASPDSQRNVLGSINAALKAGIENNFNWFELPINDGWYKNKKGILEFDVKYYNKNNFLKDINGLPISLPTKMKNLLDRYGYSTKSGNILFYLINEGYSNKLGVTNKKLLEYMGKDWETDLTFLNPIGIGEEGGQTEGFAARKKSSKFRQLLLLQNLDLEKLKTGVYKYFIEQTKYLLDKDIRIRGNTGFINLFKDEELTEEEQLAAKDKQNRDKNRVNQFLYKLRNTKYKEDLKVDVLPNDKLGVAIPSKTKILTTTQFFINDGIQNGDVLESSNRQISHAYFKMGNLENQHFIRLGYFLDFLQFRIIPKYNFNTPMIKIDTNTSTNICYVVDNVLSLDIRKTIVDNKYFIGGVDSTGNPISKPLFSGLNPFVRKSVNGDLYWGEIMNIYFSFDRL